MLWNYYENIVPVALLSKMFELYIYFISTFRTTPFVITWLYVWLVNHHIHIDPSIFSKTPKLFLWNWWDKESHPIILISSFSFKSCKNLGKLYSITLNCIIDYTLHFKLFESTFCYLNYDHYYTLHLNINFVVNLDGKVWHYVKRLIS